MEDSISHNSVNQFLFIRALIQLTLRNTDTSDC